MAVSKQGRAVVLGGGGVTGIAWEVGVLAGLHEAGVDLRADAVFGTSAGAFVGTALASGTDLRRLYSAQLEPALEERPAAVSRKLLAAWAWAVLRGFGKPDRVGAGFGAVAKRSTALVSAEQRRRTVAERLVTTEWPATLKVTATDADTGVLQVFDRTSGHPLVDVVSASGAVPGISPLVVFGDRRWIDGGMVSSANARVAEAYERVLVIAPLPKGHGGIPSVAADVKAMRRTASVELITPDQASVKAIGPNIYDPQRRASAATAGRQQGMSAAPRVAQLFLGDSATQ